MQDVANQNKLMILPLPAFQDNYIWTLRADQHCVVVDPGDASVVLEYLRAESLELEAILVTHHHPDHTGGILELLEHFPEATVFAPDGRQIPGVTVSVQQGDVVYLNHLGMDFRVEMVAGHTLDHIMYVTDQLVFSGDVIFSAGCGRIFEGTPEQMLNALDKIMRLPNETLIYCTHEYTAANLEFAKVVEPNNKTLKDSATWVERQRANHFPTVPTNVAEQKKINPFVRLDSPEVMTFAEAQLGRPAKNRLEVFTAVRKAKDNF